MQTLACYETKHLRMVGHRRQRKSVKKIEGLFAVREIAASELLNYGRVDQDCAFIQ